ncbi:hypothetical protein D3C84_449490 [compost metagenome]
MLHRELLVGGELQPSRVQAFAHQAGQPRLENTDVALLQPFDFFLVDVHANHVMPDFSQDSRLHQAHVTATKYTDFHGLLLPRSVATTISKAMLQFIYRVGRDPGAITLTFPAMTGSVAAIAEPTPFFVFCYTYLFQGRSFD